MTLLFTVIIILHENALFQRSSVGLKMSHLWTNKNEKSKGSRGILSDIPSMVGVWILLLSAEFMHYFITVKEKKYVTVLILM